MKHIFCILIFTSVLLACEESEQGNPKSFIWVDQWVSYITKQCNKPLIDRKKDTDLIQEALIKAGYPHRIIAWDCDGDGESDFSINYAPSDAEFVR